MNENMVIRPPRFAPVATRFLESPARVRTIVGPVGSGKSSVACYALMRMAMSIQPCRDGVRRSRSIIIRNTYRELVDSTIKTFHRWVPRELGTFRPSDFSFRVLGETIDAEFVFRSFDTASDLGKLLSTEFSFAMLSEARELPVELIDMIPARLRYPSQLECPGFIGRIIVESNPSDPSHWLYTHNVEQQREGHELFMQPSGLSAQAENVENLPPNYYQTISSGKPPAWVDCFVNAKWVFYGNDLPVFPEFNQGVHVAPEPITISHGLPTLVGLDFGLTPAAAIIQRGPTGQYRLIDEICTTNMGAVRFGSELKSYLMRVLGHTDVEIVGDPAGSQRAQTDESTPYDLLQAIGIKAMPAMTNDWTIRRETTARLLTTLDMGGQPSLIVSPICKTAIRGLAGDYRYQRIQVSGSARFSETPIKSTSSHIVEAMGYGLIGAREDDRVMGTEAWQSQMEQARAVYLDGTIKEQVTNGYRRKANAGT